jgi:hypothetical protein
MTVFFFMPIHLHTGVVEQDAGVKTAWFGRLDAAEILGFLLPFSIVLYLAMRGGGYDPIVRGEFGVVVWWAVLLGAISGVVCIGGWNRAVWTVVGLFGAFVVWTGVDIIWSDSAERTVLELARNASYGGVLILGLATGTREGLKRSVCGVASALALVSLIALASRLHPQWFPENEAADVLPETVKRLNYPVDYWNGLAALIAMGLPLILWVATAAERLITRAVGAAVIPAMALAGYLTLSRGGAVETAVALIVFLALHPRRSAVLPALLTTALGCLILVWAASRREDLADGLDTSAAHSQATEMIVLTLVVCSAVGLLQWAVAEARRRELFPQLRIRRRTARRGMGAAAAALVIAALAAGAPGWMSDRWQEFKQPQGPQVNETSDRFASASGNGRYQYWSASVDMAEERPLTGLGPGTWEFRWARDGTLPGFVRDAHSLYFQTAAELGVFGLLIVVGLTGFVLFESIRRTLAADPATRTLLAGAAATCATFVTAAFLDWSWQLPVVPAAFLLVAAAVLTADRDRPPGTPPIRARLLLGALAVLGLLATAMPLPAEISIRSSQDSFNAGDLPAALEHAESAADWQPYAAAPRLQTALVLERMGELDEARAAAQEAVDREPVNWRNWYVLGRLADAVGDPVAADAYYGQARGLNSRSPLFEAP